MEVGQRSVSMKWCRMTSTTTGPLASLMPRLPGTISDSATRHVACGMLPRVLLLAFKPLGYAYSQSIGDDFELSNRAAAGVAGQRDSGA
mmetsp:Transcript_18220/g.28269  ORF Transcript_18220/g.28269 Transcript_18220/m.28269 type:complete len:89 (+) Transcript_18220:2248-2514(+)